MRYYGLFLLVLFLSGSAFAGEVTLKQIAIIDSGLDLRDTRFKSVLCATGHKDFTGEGLIDLMGHGTHIAGIIAHKVDNRKQCLVIIKYYSIKHTDQVNAEHEIAAIRYAVSLNVVIANISGGGATARVDEYIAIRGAPNTRFIVAAGNNGDNLDERCDFFPACYPLSNITMVGNLKPDGTVNPSSSYGNNVKWEVGTVQSYALDGKQVVQTGTSQATAVYTSKLLERL